MNPDPSPDPDPSPVRDSRSRLEHAHLQAVEHLLGQLDPDGHWTGQLSSSALSTAVATIALGELDRRRSSDTHRSLVDAGLAWLAAHPNPDGGWGDTTDSQSNLSTTALVWAAFGAAASDANPRFAPVVRQARSRLTRFAELPPGSLEAADAAGLARLVHAIESRYGNDRTFSVPIVMTLALSGRLGRDGWKHVRALPFELAALPRAWFGALQLPVVSYALPALIALGQAIHHHAPRTNPLLHALRHRLRPRTLGLLESLQPSSGGFLEATPLTAFVTMALASFGQHQHPVAQRAASFLRDSIRPDGSWPIDTNLATWTTTLSIKALGRTQLTHPALQPSLGRLRSWLLGQQYQTVHPYTGAAPGGWAWTDLPGGVPDADDTSGALLALQALEPNLNPGPDALRAAQAGVVWLLDLQNRDGGIPTFCRGWGTLPFDRSTPDITAHALRAWSAWEPHLPEPIRRRIARARRRALAFLERSQHTDGSWVPLWFGNQRAPHDDNPVVGTSLVLRLADPATAASHSHWLCRGARFLADSQNSDGSWGGAAGVAGSIEETSLAVAGLAPFTEFHPHADRGALWIARQLADAPPQPAPIGLYFARLWYHERLYPWIWAVDALRSVLAHPLPAPQSPLTAHR